MSQSSCPNCGKPIRPGAKFCGHCGQTITASPGPAQAQTLEPQPSPGAVCPHCNKPVRPGAKFCSACGRTIDDKPAAAPAAPPQKTPAPAAVPPVTPGAKTEKTPARPAASAATPVADAPTQPEMVIPPPPKPAPAAPPPSVLPPPKRRYRFLPWVIVIGVVVCLAAVGGGLYYFDPLNWFAKETAVPTIAPTDAPTQAEVTSEPPTATATQAPTFTPPIEPTDTLPPSPTTETEPTVSPQETTSPAVDLQPGTVMLDEQFDGIIATNWRSWGKPRPLIEKGFSDNYLSLNGDNPSEAGVTTKKDFTYTPGLEIVISAQLNPTYLQYKLVINWDSIQFQRNEGDTDTGQFQIEIADDQLFLLITPPVEKCVASIDGIEAHDYRIVLLEPNGVAVYQDDGEEPVCMFADIGQDPRSGRISLRGLGFVTSVKVTMP